MRRHYLWTGPSIHVEENDSGSFFRVRRPAPRALPFPPPRSCCHGPRASLDNQVQPRLAVGWGGACIDLGSWLPLTARDTRPVSTNFGTASSRARTTEHRTSRLPTGEFRREGHVPTESLSRVSHGTPSHGSTPRSASVHFSSRTRNDDARRGRRHRTRAEPAAPAGNGSRRRCQRQRRRRLRALPAASRHELSLLGFQYAGVARRLVRARFAQRRA